MLLLNLLLLTALFFVAILFRYLLISSAFHYLVFHPFRKKESPRILNQGVSKPTQLRKEILWSCLTSLAFAVAGAAMIILWQEGYTKVYTQWADYPMWYLPISLFLAFFLHETYYYWLHRWMHLPHIYRVMHKVHHDSIETTSWTAFSFHPLESFAQAIIIPLILFLIPMHLSMLILFLVIMTVSATINHSGVELFPHNFHRHWLGKWLIGATHHDLHHKKFRTNFGLYFTFWDKWMGTESKYYQVKAIREE